MTDKAGNKLINQIYSRIYDIVTTLPTEADRNKVPDADKAGGKFSASNTAIQLSIPGIPLYSDDFENMWTLGNPRGVKSRTALFSVLVDAIPATKSASYEQTPRRVSNAYSAVALAANAHGQQMSKKTKTMLDKVNKFLFCEIEEPPSPFAEPGTPGTKRTDKTEVYKRYEQLNDDIDDAKQELLRVSAQAGKIADGWSDEFSKSEIAAMSDEEKRSSSDKALRQAEDYWEDKSYGAQKRLDKMLTEFHGDANIKYVREALDFQANHGNELSSTLLSRIKKLVELGDYSDPTMKIPIKLSFPSSTKFAEADYSDGYMNISCNTEKYSEKHDKFNVAADLGLKGIIKLVTFGVKAGGGTSTDTLDTELEKISVSFDICFVNIMRPWLDATLFSKYIQWDAGRDQPAGSVSSGKIETQTDDHLLPMIPMQMIVTKNVKITSNWSKEHKQTIEEKLKGGFSIGWGPFAIGPSIDQSFSHFKQDKNSEQSTLTCPGIQCLGFVSWVPPKSAPLAGDNMVELEIDKNMVSGDSEIVNNANTIVDQARLPPDQREAKYQKDNL